MKMSYNSYKSKKVVKERVIKIRKEKLENFEIPEEFIYELKRKLKVLRKKMNIKKKVLRT